MEKYRNREFTQFAALLIKKFIPQIISDSYYFKYFLGFLYFGRDVKNFDFNFKSKVLNMNHVEFMDAYRNSPESKRYRETDCSKFAIKRIMDIIKNENEENIVDLGGADGTLWEKLDNRFRITICDMNTYQIANNSNIRFVKTNIENTPFDDFQFDIAVTTHVLEHVIYFTKTLNEMLRISKKQIILVPLQSYENYTIDYHINFFPSKGQFLLRLKDSGVNLDRINAEVLRSNEILVTIGF